MLYDTFLCDNLAYEMGHWITFFLEEHVIYTIEKFKFHKLHNTNSSFHFVVGSSTTEYRRNTFTYSLPHLNQLHNYTTEITFTRHCQKLLTENNQSQLTKQMRSMSRAQMVQIRLTEYHGCLIQFSR
jgi:hypothetical protein